MPRIVENPYGKVYLLDIGDGAAFLVTEVEDPRTRRVTTTSLPLSAAEVGSLARYAYYELVLPASKRLEQDGAIEAEHEEHEPQALPLASALATLPPVRARGRVGSVRGRPKTVDYEEVARLYREGERLAKAGELPDGIYGYITEQQGIGEFAAQARVGKARRLGLLKRGRSRAHTSMPPKGSIDYAEVARLYMSTEAGTYTSRRRYVAATLGITDSAAMNRAGKARKLGLIPPDWSAAPARDEAGAARLRALVAQAPEAPEAGNGYAEAPVEPHFP